MRSAFVVTGFLAVGLTACASGSSGAPVAQASDDLVARARAIHQRVITVDTHDDIPGNFATPEVDPLNYPRQVNLEKMKAGGLDVAFFAVFVGQGPRTPEGNERAKAAAMEKFNAIHRLAESMYPDRIGIAYTPDDVTRLHAAGKLVAAIGIENGYVIGEDLSLIEKYYDLGARYMTLAHTRNNDICDSSTDSTAEHHGVSAFGKKVVAEMNRVGMIVDISHVSRECMMQATAMSTSPVIASHSSTTAEANVPRNLDDEQLRAIAKNGGVAQMVALGDYVRAPDPRRRAAQDSLRQALGITGGRGGGGGGGGRGGRGGQPMSPEDSARAARFQQGMAAIDARFPRPTVKDFVDHIDHAVKVAGIDHVGISSDFDGGGGIVGWNDASESFNLTLELVRRGYSEERVRKLWGGNVLRVWAENQKRATRIKA